MENLLTFLSPVELLATLFGLTCVWLTLKENIWCWPAGLVQVTRERDPADLLKLFVDPPFIGRGLGRCLFDWACACARVQGARALTIESDPDALPFYLAMGARRTGWAPSGSIPGRRLPLLELRLPGAP